MLDISPNFSPTPSRRPGVSPSRPGAVLLCASRGGDDGQRVRGLLLGAHPVQARKNDAWPVAVQRYGFGADQVGWVSLAAGLGVLIGQTAAGGRVGEHPRLLFIAACVGSGSLIGLSLIRPLPAVATIILMAAAWLTHGVVMVSTVILLVDRSPAGRAVTLTLNSSAQSFGWAVGAGTGGIVLAAAGYVALGLWTLVLPLGSALLIFIRQPSRGPV
jgi:predicted MFS family arabinose efflux permease